MALCSFDTDWAAWKILDAIVCKILKAASEHVGCGCSEECFTRTVGRPAPPAPWMVMPFDCPWAPRHLTRLHLDWG